MVVRDARRELSTGPLLSPRPPAANMTDVSAAAAVIGSGAAPSCLSTATTPTDDGDVDAVSAARGAQLTPEVPSQPSSQEASPQKQPVPRGYIPPALQNCLRCDACSCIYLDELDYYKHVRNYHSSTTQRRYRKSSQCRTCVFTKIDPDQVTKLKGLQNQPRTVAPVKINVLQNNVKSRWSRMFGSRLRGQLTPLSSGLRAIDPSRVPLKSKVKMQAGLQPFVVRELDAKMREMKQQRAAGGDRGDICIGGGAATCSVDSGAAVLVKEEPRDPEAECAALLQQVEVRIKTEPDESET